MRVLILGLGILWGLSAIMSEGGAAEQRTTQKRLIEFGWDEPDTAFMRKHAAEMERTPFDGCVFHVDATTAGGKREGFTWACWGTRAFTDAELQPAVDDLRAAGFTRFTENFLRFNVTPGKVDWFDDFGPIVNNARLAARVAREGKCRGVLFDIEQYEARLWNYDKQRDAKTKSWDEYAAQVRKRGREVMAAFQEGYPGLTVFLTFAYSLPNAQSGGDPAKLAKADYGLLAPFLDGMIDAADVNSGVKIVDGCELAYGYKEASQYAKAAQTMRTGVLPLVKADHDTYRRTISVGFGVWMAIPSGTGKWMSWL